MSACPAFVMTAIALKPAAALFVIAVCRKSVERPDMPLDFFAA